MKVCVRNEDGAELRGKIDMSCRVGKGVLGHLDLFGLGERKYPSAKYRIKVSHKGFDINPERKVQDYAELFGVDEDGNGGEVQLDVKFVQFTPTQHNGSKEAKNSHNHSSVVSLEPHNDSILEQSDIRSVDSLESKHVARGEQRKEETRKNELERITTPEKQPRPSFTSQKHSELKKFVELASTQFCMGLKLNAIKNFKKALEVNITGLDDMKANIQMCLGFLYNMDGQLDNSLHHFQHALEIFFKLYGVRSELTGCITANIGNLFIETEDYVQAMEFQKSALTIIASLEEAIQSRDKAGEEHEGALSTLTNRSLKSKNDQEAAAISSAHSVVSYNLALLHYKMGNTSSSLEICKKVLEEYLSTFGEDDLRVGDVFNLIGDNLWRMKIHADSMDFMEKALRIYQNLLGDRHMKVACILEKQAMYHAEVRQDMQVALETLTTVLSIKKELVGDSPLVADTYFNIARVYLLTSHQSKCAENLAACCEILMASMTQHATEPPSHLYLRLLHKYTKACHLLICLNFNLGDYTQAEKRLSTFERLLSNQSISRTLKCFCLDMKSMLHFHQGNKERAYTISTQALQLSLESYGSKHCKTREAYYRLGKICLHLDKTDEALIYLSSAGDLGEGGEAALPSGSTYFKYKADLEEMMDRIN